MNKLKQNTLIAHLREAVEPLNVEGYQKGTPLLE